MIKIKILIAALLLAPVIAPASEDATIKENLLEIERHIGRANLACDYELFRAVEGKEFFFTDTSGQVTTRDQDLAGEKDCKKHNGDFSLTEPRVLLYGDTAVVNAIGTYQLTNSEGKAVHRSSRFTDVFVKRNGSWVLVAGHSSNLKDPAK
jgi:hypothetical protein